MRTSKKGEQVRQRKFFLISVKIMIYSIEISAQAEADLRGIYEYIAYELKSSKNASGQIDRIEMGILNLEQMPERYRQYEEEPWHSRGLRIVTIDNYCVFYLVDEKRAVVNIVRVMYGGRDINAQLEESCF